MEKVLLAIDGTGPDKKSLRYALQLCRQIKAELDVLQVIKIKNILEKSRQKTIMARNYIEAALVASAYAEAGESETAKDMMAEAVENLKRSLSESGVQNVKYHVTIRAGDPRKEIINYLNEHRDVVVTIYDATDYKRLEASKAYSTPSLASELSQILPMPLVVIKPKPFIKHICGPAKNLFEEDINRGRNIRENKK
ncbi:MAG: universal stress protein [Deltaproteobacteria bacterium]|nr:universal stress protein [Deltaproteobacteria bacterium]MBW2152369.1 universal stress protein [Deltaproteobacteria bacterium]